MGKKQNKRERKTNQSQMQSTKFFTLTGVMSSQSDFDKINEMYLWSYDVDLNLLFWQSLQPVVCPSIVLYHLFSLFSFMERLSSVNRMWRFRENFDNLCYELLREHFCHHCIANTRVQDQTSGRFPSRLKLGLSTRLNIHFHLNLMNVVHKNYTSLTAIGG